MMQRNFRQWVGLCGAQALIFGLGTAQAQLPPTLLNTPSKPQDKPAQPTPAPVMKQQASAQVKNPQVAAGTTVSAPGAAAQGPIGTTSATSPRALPSVNDRLANSEAETVQLKAELAELKRTLEELRKELARQTGEGTNEESNAEALRGVTEQLNAEKTKLGGLEKAMKDGLDAALVETTVSTLKKRIAELEQRQTELSKRHKHASLAEQVELLKVRIAQFEQALAAAPPRAVESAVTPAAPVPVEVSQTPWTEGLNVRAFADAYYNLSLNRPLPAYDAASHFPRAFEIGEGFNLAWAGFDATYNRGMIGGTVGLRFGPATLPYHGAKEQPLGLLFVKQAFLHVAPSERLSFDLGKFDTILGSEVADSQDNFNYTRGLLCYWAQPFFHTGLRANFKASSLFALNAMLVDGWGNSAENNDWPSLAVQGVVTPSDRLTLSLGFISGPEQDAVVRRDSTGPDGSPVAESVSRPAANHFKTFRHLGDAVIKWAASDAATLLLNLSYGSEGILAEDLSVTHKQWMGAALSGRYALSPAWALAARAEYLRDPDGWMWGKAGLEMASATLTLETIPQRGLILRLEGRDDFVVASPDSYRMFWRGLAQDATHNPTVILGAVVQVP